MSCAFPEVMLASPEARVAGIPESLIFGRSETMHSIRERLGKVARTNIPVLIVGECGTGKEVLAHYVHARSPVAAGPFVRINCPGLPGALLESELFGYEEGAFTGATTAKAGLVEAASGGTLFLDGIGELELSLQSKLLQFLQDRQFTRIGGQRTLQADVRILCASSQPLEAEVESGRFRRDLFYRINVVTVQLPALRERRTDIPDLIDYFLATFSAEFGRTPHPLPPSTCQVLTGSDWPGNIRQLENAIKRFVILDSEDSLLSEVCGGPLPLNLPSADPAALSLKQITRHATRVLERKVILDVLSAHRWNRRRAAKALHISYRALLYKMKQGGLPAKHVKPEPPAHEALDERR
jgi:two-component system, NtrC family, response regulator AtoC